MDRELTRIPILLAATSAMFPRKRASACGQRGSRPPMPRRVRLRKLHGDRELPHCQRMLNFTDLASVPSHHLAPFTHRLRLAVGAYLAASRAPSCTSGRSKRSAGSDPPPSPGGSS